jgi:lipopolysaccharide transport system ATP-binding protein
MYMRLAFAVAAHLEPEILVVDEVLAVGDAQFQKKCLGKMGEAARGGRTILFVTHNMAALRQLCPRAIRLHQGRIHREGPSQAIVEEYLAEGVARVDLHDLRAAIRALPPDPAFELLDVSLTQDGGVPTAFLNGEPIDVTIHYRIVQPTHGVRIYIDLCDEDQDLLIRSFDDELDESPHARQPGQYAAVVQIPADLLSPRDYTLMVHATIHNVRSLTGEGLAVPLKVEHTSRINGAYPHEPIRGRLLPPMRWATHAVEDARV